MAEFRQAPLEDIPDDWECLSAGLAKMISRQSKFSRQVVQVLPCFCLFYDHGTRPCARGANIFCLRITHRSFLGMAGFRVPCGKGSGHPKGLSIRS